MIRFSSTINKHRHIHPKCGNFRDAKITPHQISLIHNPVRFMTHHEFPMTQRLPDEVVYRIKIRLC